jgi:hypothetical protein
MQHKWHKEIKAWADGVEVEMRWSDGEVHHEWSAVSSPNWGSDLCIYRIKPQPKEPKYLYVWLDKDTKLAQLETYKPRGVLEDGLYKYIGKIKLEVDDE